MRTLTICIALALSSAAVAQQQRDRRQPVSPAVQRLQHFIRAQSSLKYIGERVVRLVVNRELYEIREIISRDGSLSRTEYPKGSARQGIFVVENSRLDGETLETILITLLDDEDKRRHMAQRMRAWSVVDADDRAAKKITELVGKSRFVRVHDAVLRFAHGAGN